MSVNRTLKISLLFGIPMLLYFLIALYMRDHYVKLRVETSSDSVYSGLYKLPLNGVHVHGEGSFDDKLSEYNASLSNIRINILKKNSKRSEQIAIKGCNLVAGNKETYLDKLSEISNVTGVFLDWTEKTSPNQERAWSSLNDHSNLLIRSYFAWVGTKKLCSLIKGEKFTHHRYDTVFNKQCTTNISTTLVPSSFELFVLNALPISPKYFYPDQGNSFIPRMYTDLPKYLTYLHIFEQAVVTTNGEVYKDDRKVVAYTCHSGFNCKAPTFHLQRLAFHHEIFSLSQFWGKAFYHKMAEGFPKLAPYLDFLKTHKEIKVHVAETGRYTQSLLNLLGIEPSRLVTGNLKGGIIYLPRGTPCGFPHVVEVQLLSRTIRDTLVKMENQHDERRILILIRRSGRRHFTQGEETAGKLSDLCKEFKMKFYLFKDNPLPSLNETIYAFNRAIMVVAPHGAGLSNLLYSEPGTYVIEGLCNPPHTNMCYTRLSYILGHHYHGLVSRGGCEGHVDIPASEIQHTARVYLQQLKDHGEL